MDSHGVAGGTGGTDGDLWLRPIGGQCKHELFHCSGLKYPLGCAYSAATSRLFVVESDAHRVAVFSLAASHGELSHSVEPQCDGDRRLFNCGSQRGEELPGHLPGAAPGELQDPYDVAVHEGHVYVTDSGNNRVAVFAEADGAFVANLVVCASKHQPALSDPSGLALLPGCGRLVVAETSGRVRVFAPPLLPGAQTYFDDTARYALPLTTLQVFCPSPSPLPTPWQSGEDLTPPISWSFGGVCADESSSSGRVVVLGWQEGVRGTCALHVLEPATQLAHAEQVFATMTSTGSKSVPHDDSSNAVGAMEHLQL